MADVRVILAFPALLPRTRLYEQVDHRGDMAVVRCR
jgi:hypothetical protein